LQSPVINCKIFRKIVFGIDVLTDLLGEPSDDDVDASINSKGGHVYDNLIEAGKFDCDNRIRDSVLAFGRFVFYSASIVDAAREGRGKIV
jgi:hypothetical protein